MTHGDVISSGSIASFISETCDASNYFLAEGFYKNLGLARDSHGGARKPTV